MNKNWISQLLKNVSKIRDQFSFNISPIEGSSSKWLAIFERYSLKEANGQNLVLSA